MQELRDQLGSLEVTPADNIDPARVIEELRRICVELDDLGDKVFAAGKTLVLFTAFQDKHYTSFKTVLLCERRRDGGSALDFEDVVNRATSYHALQIHGKVSSHNDCIRSHDRALNTVVRSGARGLKKAGVAAAEDIAAWW